MIQLLRLGPDEAERLIRWAIEIRRFHAACTAALKAAYGRPAVDSQIDRISRLTEPMADTGLAAARLRLDAGADHLLAIAALLETNPPPRLALYSLMRTVLETAAIAAWLYGEGLTPDERAQRGRRARANNLDEVIKLTGSADAKANLAALNTPRLPDTTSLLRGLLPSIHPRSGKPIGEVLFRQLGGRAHGEIWSTIGGQQVAGGVTTSLVAFSLDPEVIAGALGPTVELFEKATKRCLALAGLTAEPAFADLGLPHLD
jgi:hypothetical protein